MNFKNDTAFSLMGFVPALVVQYLMRNMGNKQLPDKQTFRSVVMFADISGFTNLTETLSKIGYEGCELTAFVINRYMELLVQAVSRSGGDIFKFAGDAIIVVWPPSQKETLESREEELNIICRQAIQSVLDYKSMLANTNILGDIKLSVKIGFGIGDISIIYVGGVFGRCEYLATGDPLTQAFQSEHQCKEGGETFVSEEVHEVVKEYFNFEESADEYYKRNFYKLKSLKKVQKVKMKADALLIKNNITLLQFDKIKNQVLKYIPAALVPYINIDQEQWSSELRRITILFINLGVDLSDANTNDGLQRIQKVIETVQKCVYMHEGSLNKLLMDDKGSTLIVCFGLPPLMHQDDSTRAILTAFTLIKQLYLIDCKCKIGIATGTVFTGVVGTSGSRREYSVLGDAVNLAARLMQLAITNKENKHILLCKETKDDCLRKIQCRYWQSVQLKGKSGLTEVFEPLNHEKRKNQELSTHKLLNGEMIGFEDEKKKIFSTLDNWMNQCKQPFTEDLEREFLLIRGSFGIGKTQLVQQTLKKFLEDNAYQFKYGEKIHFFISELSPITKTLWMNGIRSIICQVFEVLCKRKNTQPSSEYLRILIGYDEEWESQFQKLQEILGLVQTPSLVDTFMNRQQQFDENYSRLERKALGKAVVKLFQNFLEEFAKNMKNLSVRFRLEINQIIAPVIILLDDIQYYDELSLYLLKVLLKNFSRIQIIAVARDQYWELPYTVKPDKTPNKKQMILFENGLNSINNQDQINTTIIELSQIKLCQVQEILKLYFNIQKMEDKVILDDQFMQKRVSKIERARETFSIATEFGDKVRDHLLFWEFKETLQQTNFLQFFCTYLYILSQGHPLIIIDIIENLLQKGLIKTEKEGVFFATDGFYSILNHQQWLGIDSPLCCIKMMSPMIDRLTCLECLILKFASVLGETFDIQTLYKILPFKNQIPPENLIRIIKELDSQNIIEYMEGDGENQYFRFSYPFFREVLYQRMTYGQRRQIHKSAALVLQTISQTYDYMNQIRRLEYHWQVAETKPQINKQVWSQTLSIEAKRSIIVKHIHTELTRSKHDVNTPIRMGYLERQSDKLIYWMNRFCVLTCKELKMYENEDIDQEPCGVIPLKQISSIVPVYDTFQRSNCIKLVVSSWIKHLSEETQKDLVFSCSSEKDMELWMIYLEYSRANAIFNNFADQYGKISFPINLRVYDYDTSISMELTEQARKVNLSLKMIETVSPLRLIQRQSKLLKIPLTNKALTYSIFLNQNRNKSVSLQKDDEETDVTIKDCVKLFLYKSMLLFWVHLISHQYEKTPLILGECGKFVAQNVRFFDLKQSRTLKSSQRRKNQLELNQ